MTFVAFKDTCPVCHAEHVPLKPANTEDAAVYQRIADNFMQEELTQLRARLHEVSLDWQTTDAECKKLRAEVSALAAQNKQMVEAAITLLTHIEDVVGDENWKRIDPKLWNAVTAISIPDLSTTPLARVRAEAMREAADYLENRYPLLKNRCDEIRAKADEILKEAGL